MTRIPLPVGLTAALFGLSLTMLALDARAAFTLTGAVSVTVGDHHACALTSADKVKCWGGNTQGELGDGTKISRPFAGEALLVSADATTTVTAGWSHTCSSSAAGVKCWGGDIFGQFGNGYGVTGAEIVLVPGLPANAPISANAAHTCALAGGGVQCWGVVGALNDMYWSVQETPTAVPGISDAVQLSTGAYHACVVNSVSGALCWGDNQWGQLGNGTILARPTLVQATTPSPVSGLASGVVRIAAGGNFSCALVTPGGVKCWGYNSNGQLGNGTNIGSTVPVEVSTLGSGVYAITAGSSHACAIIASTGGVKCWGSNQYGQLGDGSFGDSSTPVNVVGLTNIVAISAGVYHTCAVTATGMVLCWGRNDSGQLGNGTTGAPSTTPVAVMAVTMQTIDFAPLPARDWAEGSFTVSATASSGLTVSFFSITPAICGVSGTTVTFMDRGICGIRATQAGNADVWPAENVDRAFVILDAAAAAVPRLKGISTRAPVLGGDNVPIAGFVIGGTVPKTVVVRARGPSLAEGGVAATVRDPLLSVFGASGLITSTNDWGNAMNAFLLEALGLAPSNAREAAVLLTLAPGAYTAVAEGITSGDTGVVIVEVYEVDHPESQLTGISTRALVTTGDNVVIGGFAIEGTGSRTVVVRARGPSLLSQGVSSAILNPQITLYSGQTVIASNDDWQSAANAAAIFASGFAPADPREAAILVTLPPGAYTVVMSGVGNTIGVGILEVFAQ